MENPPSNHFLNAPFDIFCSITSHTSPGDLLSLSRVSHRLRDVVLSRKNRDIWKESISRIGLPDCPDGMSEPQYASLMYDTYCHLCNATKESDDTVQLRQVIFTRLCRRCAAKNILKAESIVPGINTTSIVAIAKSLGDINPNARLPFETRPIIAHNDHEQIVREFDTMAHLRSPTERNFYKPLFLKAYSEYQYLSSRHRNEWGDYLLTRRDHMKKIRDLALLLQKWETSEIVKEEMKKRIEAGRAGVQNILTQLGYTWPDMWGYVECDEYKTKWDSFFYEKRRMQDPDSPEYEILKKEIADLMRIMKTPISNIISTPIQIQDVIAAGNKIFSEYGFTYFTNNE